MTETAVENVDILIVGAGPVGMTLHLALAAGGQKSLLLDRRPPAALQTDPRALALSHGARELLEQIHSWPTRAATPIETIHISQKDGFGRTLLDRADYQLPALGYVVRYRDLAAALATRLAPDRLLAEAEILDIAGDADGATVALRHAGQLRRLRFKLLAHAEGTPGDEAGVKVAAYGQHAVICEVTPVSANGPLPACLTTLMLPSSRSGKPWQVWRSANTSVPAGSCSKRLSRSRAAKRSAPRS